MQLQTYIKDLLYRYECVILPGFGAFLTHRRSAYIDTDDSFHPPSKYVSFNRQLQTNDGLLANYVCSSENLSYETSLQKIRLYASQLSREITENGQVSMEEIGEFTLNAEGSVTFSPFNVRNYDSAAFGLTSFVSPKIDRRTEESVVLAEKESAVVSLEPAASKAIPFIRYAAIGIIAIALSGTGGMEIYQGSVEKHNFAEKQKADSLIDRKIEAATFVIDDPMPAITVTVPEITGRYHIVAGAFRIEANADKKLNQLIDAGYRSRIIGKNRYGLHQVVYDSYQSRVEALQQLRKLKRTENPDAWLLVQ